MNLEVFREQDTVWIRDTDTDDEWPLPAEVWYELVHAICFVESDLLGFPSVWGQVSVESTGASASDIPDGRG